MADSEFTRAIETLDRETDLEAQRRFREKARPGAGWALRGMVGSFWRVYFSQGARKEGVKGLFRAVNAGMFPFLVYAKVWELERSGRRDG